MSKTFQNSVLGAVPSHPVTSQPEPQLRASAMNALGHGADSLYTPLANPVSEWAALRGAAAIAAALDEAPAQRDHTELALGSVLCAYALDSAGLGLHHVVCQTLVRICGSPHAETNAAILPRAAAFLASSSPTSAISSLPVPNTFRRCRPLLRLQTV